MLTIKPRHVERTIGFLAALVVFCFLQIVWEYRDSRCRPQQQNAEHSPADQQPIATPPTDRNGEQGRQQPAQNKHNPLPVGCNVIGFIPAAINLMDEHEGFFVGFFTLVLAGSTILLWRATADLYEAGERQITIATNSLDASRRATQTLVSMERPYVTGGGDFKNEWGKELFRLDVENHGKTAAFMTGYDLQFAKLADLQTEHPKVRPVCKNKFRHIDGISPQGARKEIRTQRRKPCGDDVVFGAIYYRDIFDRPHHSRFILRIAPWRDVPGEGLTRLDVEGVSREYWSWDIPKNEQA